jgi:hypothetical protein
MVLTMGERRAWDSARRLCLAMRDHHPEGPGGFASARQAGMRREMKTFEELRQVMTRDLLELRKLEGSRFTTIEKRHSAEQEFGRWCYEAEEDLELSELNMLKRVLGLA